MIEIPKIETTPGSADRTTIQPGPFGLRTSILGVLVVFLLSLHSTLHGAELVTIPSGIYEPLFRSDFDVTEVPVASFQLDKLPVTNADFLEFVKTSPRWQKSKAKRIFADSNYLQHWESDLDPGGNAPANAPVTYISWFAAKAYAQWQDKRLPTTAEWELVAAASPDQPNASKDPKFLATILNWYGLPTPDVSPEIGKRPPNYFGIQDLHGLVWEWTSDFNTALVTGESRGDTGIERQLFCGAGSQGAPDRSNYAAFMRFGFRSSLKASYCVNNLGFRCARDIEDKEQP